MKGNKGKEVVGEGDRPEARDARPEVPSQIRLSAGEKRKFLPKNMDLGCLPSRRDKRVKHASYKVTKPNLPQSNPTIQTIDVDVSPPVETTSSKTPPRMIISALSQPPSKVSSNIIENEDLAWEHFGEAVKDKDINACYDMSVKDFEYSGVQDLFKVTLLSSRLYYFIIFRRLTKHFSFVRHVQFIAASRQAIELNKTRILLETTIQNVRDKSKKWAGIAAKAKEKATKHQDLTKELKADIVEKDAHLDHIQKKNNELGTLLSKAKEDAVAEFKASKEFTDLLDRNYTAGFEDFRLDAVETSLK